MSKQFIDVPAIRSQAQAQWRSNYSLREEFRRYEHFEAFVLAEARGLVGIWNSPSSQAAAPATAQQRRNLYLPAVKRF